MRTKQGPGNVEYVVVLNKDSSSRGYRPFGTVRDFWFYQGREVMLAGPYETGKTFGALQKLHTLLLKYDGAQAIMVRKSYASLKKSALQTYYKKVLPNPPGHVDCPVNVYGGGNPEVIYYPNLSELHLGGMDYPDKVLSSEWDYIFVPQAEELTHDEWMALLSRCTGRAGNVPYPQFMGDCNPDIPTHWIINRPALNVLHTKHVDNPTLYVWETYKTEDGKWDWRLATDEDGKPVLTKQGERTMEALDSLEGVRYKRGRLGLWVGAEGQVYESFDPEVHVFDPRALGWVDGRPPSHWHKYISIDFGYRHPFVCYDDQTEVLTSVGWRKFNDVPKDALVATVKDGTGKLQYQFPRSYIEQDYSGPMIQGSPKGKLGVDFCVTPNHQMVLVHRKTGKLKKVDAADLVNLRDSSWAIPTGWEPYDSTGNLSDDDPGPEMARLIGLYIADGYLSHKGGGKYIRIAQKDYKDEVRGVLRDTGYAWSEYENKTGVVEFSIGSVTLFEKFWSMFGDVNSSTKFIPRDCFFWSTESRQALFDGMYLGDGSKSPCRSEYYTISPKLADDMQELAASLGMPSKIRKQKRSGGYDTSADGYLYAIRFHKFKRAIASKVDIETVDYDGKVYCFEVNNGTLVVRRNGRPMVCGNCQWWAEDEDGRLYMYREIFYSERTVQEHVTGEKSTFGGIRFHSQGERYQGVICDWDAEDRATLENLTAWDTINADKRKRVGYDAVLERLKVQPDGRPRIMFSRDALIEIDEQLEDKYAPIKTVDEFPSYVWRELPQGKEMTSRDEEAVKKHDDGMDAMRYMVMHLDGESRKGSGMIRYI